MSLNEYKFRVFSHCRHAFDNILNISFFIAARDYNGTRCVVLVPPFLACPGNDNFIQSQLTEERHLHDYPV